MALDFLTLADSKLEKTYTARPEKDRTPERRTKLVEGIDAALKQVGKADSVRGWYSTNAGVVRAQVRCGSKLLSIKGQDAFYVPAERAADFYKGVRQAANKGELDGEIKAAFAVTASSASGTPVVRAKRQMSDEHRAKIAAAAKARHAAKRAAGGGS